MVIAHHLILTGYGHWLPNDPRGSMSLKTYSPELAQLAEAHFGRRQRQPTLAQLRAFYRKAEGMLAFPVLWFDENARDTIAGAIGGAIESRRLTCYACAVLRNHVHLLIRKHGLSGEEMSHRFRDAARAAIAGADLCNAGHPVFSADVCDHYKSDPQSVRACIDYIRANPRRHRLPPQTHEFIAPYDDWPHSHQRIP